MAELTKAKILQAEDLGCERVDIPEWGGHAYVRAFSGDERDAWEESILGDDRKVSAKGLRALFAVAVLCDGKGAPMFADADAEALGKKSAAALDRIFDVGAKLNRLRPEDVEELAKNSGGGRGESSGSS